MRHPDNGYANALSVDVEEYYQAEIFNGVIERADWDRQPQRVKENTLRLLQIFENVGIRATFFFLGMIAEEYPELVRRIADGGHEIASHGYGHQMVTKMTPREFRHDLRVSKRILEDLSGREIKGYRAPTFSIKESCAKWAYEILDEEGFRYSSSVYPISHDRYGWPAFGTAPRRMTFTGSGGVWEIPLATYSLGAMRVPFGGGGYLRLYPLLLTTYLFSKCNRSNNPCVVYLHPWEIDTDHPRIMMPLLKRLRHYTGIPRMEGKIRRLLALYPFGTMASYVDSLESVDCPG